MRSIVVASTLAIAALGFAAPAAFSATDKAPGETKFAHTEIRTSDSDFGATRYHLWRLQPGGRLAGTYTALRNINVAAFHEDRSDAGRWWVEGNALCLQFKDWYGGKKNCYQISGLQRNWVRMDNTAAQGPSFRATIDYYR
jgi:hypothetical protein